MEEEKPDVQTKGLSEKYKDAPIPQWLEARDIGLRLGPSFSDEMRVCRANIYEVLGPKDDRLKVRPLPYFANIDKEEEKNLPNYPPFFRGQVITGKSEKKDGTKAEQVWIACTPDFQLGYVLGKASAFGENTKSRYAWSYDYNKVKQFLHQRRALPSDFSYENLDVIRWYASDRGGMIELVNHKTGDWVLMNSSGSVVTVQQKKIYLRVGTPPDPVSSGPVAFSMISMTPDKIHMKSPNVEIDAKDLVLGHHGLNLVGTGTMAPICGTNGTSAQAILNIHV